MNTQDLIFVVDDDPVYVNVLKFNLFELGYKNVETYTTGKEFLDNLYRLPKIVLLDYILSDSNGDHLLTETLTFDSDIIVVMISSQKKVELAVETLKMGAFDYLVKDDSVKSQLAKFFERVESLQAEIKKDKRIRKIRFFGIAAIITVLVGLSLIIKQL